ncbi:unnamed protein product [Symbiodinium sp. CCMP2592]|nr:unnamed protein product [Symbiodinium sp. CCMP2592]
METQTWNRLQGLYSFANTSPTALDGETSCFELEIVGQPVQCESSVLIRVHILQHLQTTLRDGSVVPIALEHPNRKAVLRMTSAQWASMGVFCRYIRALWTQVRVNDTVVVLDSVRSPAFLAGDVRYRNDDVIHAAEIFCGGFAGWTEAAWVLKDAGCPLQVDWLLDIQEDLRESLEVLLPDLLVANTSLELEEHMQTDNPVFVAANFEHPWWNTAWALKPVDVVVCSPPCQPWSSAGQQAGLNCPDGRLLLQMADLMGVARVPVVCLEEVAGFCEHSHFAEVMQAWRAAGYEFVFKESLQLADVLPTWRKRSMLILVHVDLGPEAQKPLQVITWTKVSRPSLHGMIAYFPVLPDKLLQPCRISEEVLSKYLDPWYLPPSLPPSPENMKRFRLCSPAQQCKTFMAAYHYQHELPEGTLSRKGLLCSLLRVGETVRFFAGPEIASCHGAQRKLFLEKDDRQCMQKLGNSLAVPQAAVTLAHATNLLIPMKRVDPALAASLSVNGRMTCANCALFRVKTGWLMVRLDEVGAMLARKHLRQEIELHLRSRGQVFHQVKVQTATGEAQESACLQVWFSSHVSVAQVLEVLGTQAVAPQTVGEDASPLNADLVTVDQPPYLRLAADIVGDRPLREPLCLCTPAGLYVVLPGTPDFYHQLKYVFDGCRHPAAPSVMCLTCFGTPVPDVMLFPRLVCIATEAQDIYFAGPMLGMGQIRDCHLRRTVEGFLLHVPAEHAVAWFLQAPCHLLECLGWTMLTTGDGVPADAPLQFRIQPNVDYPGVPANEVPGYLRDLLFLSQVRAHAAAAETSLIGPFMLQVGARTLGQLSLAPRINADKLEHFWRVASNATGCWPGAQIFSGPRRLHFTTVFEQLGEAAFHRNRATGLLVLTVVPEVRGGGVKDENVQLAKSRIASLFLDRRMPLSAASTATDALVPALGATACLQAMSLPSTQERWQQLSKSAHAVGKDLPQGDNRTERAANRIQAAVRRRRLARTQHIQASEFLLEEGTWCGMDESPVPILTQLQAGCTGAILIDPSEANGHDLDLLRNMGSDAIVWSYPAIAVRMKPRVLARSVCPSGTWPQDIAISLQHVAVDGAVCCSFAMHSDDCPQGLQWNDAVQAPVRTVVQQFRAKGLQQALSHPWGRGYRAKGRPSLPSHADTFQFFAKVVQADLKAVLQHSGFNHVFVVPRTWDRKVLPGWSVVWLPGTRHELEKQAVVVPEQHGRVRGRSKLGLRVPAPDFTKVFGQLRPGAPAPVAVDVRLLFKGGPFPHAASADDISQWARKLGWQVKVVKALGPQFWLLGSAGEPPAPTAHFNDVPVLLSPVKSRDAKMPIVQAGGPIPSMPRRPVAHDNGEEDPWLHGDPWSAYKPKQAPAGLSVTPFTPVKTADQQLTAKVHDQESKLAQLEQDLQALRADQAAALQSQASDKAQLRHELQTVRVEVQGLGQGLQQQMQANLDSLRAASAQQEQQVAAGMAELKALLLASTENKKARTSADHDLCASGICHNQCHKSVALAPTGMHRLCRLQCPVPFESLLPLRGLASPSQDVAGLPTTCQGCLASRWLLLLVPLLPPPIWRPRLNCGTRIGEASHPGPGQTLLTSYFGDTQGNSLPPSPSSEDACVISVVNPTSVLHKEQLFCELQADVLALSETSAVQQVQTITGRAMHKHGYRVHWGHPVASHCKGTAAAPNLRGLAAGVALAARLPSRCSRPGLPADIAATCRIAEAFVRLGPLEVRFITVYGHQAAMLDAKDHNECLLRAALDRATQNAMPCIIAGDFNLCPLDLPSGQCLARLLYQEILQFHLKRTGIALPPTCKNSTRHDTALLHPSLVSLWDGAWVLSGRHLFDAHDPLCFRLRLPHCKPCRHVWRFPRSWSELGVQKDQLQASLEPECAKLRLLADQCDSPEAVDLALQTFAIAAERAVDSALRRQHQLDPVKCPHRFLAKAYRGRCKPRQLVKSELPSLARPDRGGGYDPDVEVTSVLGRLRVRQVRRIHTLCKGLVAANSAGTPLSSAQRRQLCQEWTAIGRAAGYTPSFPQWVLQVACFHHFPECLPDLEWLRDLLQYVRYDCDALVRQQARARADSFKYHVQRWDQAEGHSRKGYTALRPPPKPAFVEVPVTVTCQVVGTDNASEGCRAYRLERPSAFREGSPAQLGDCVCQVKSAEGVKVVLQGLGLPAAGQLSQTNVACTADELHEAFVAYWGPIWQRDVELPHDDLADWPRFREILTDPNLSFSPLQLRSFAPDLWRQAIQKMATRKATGVCGWSPADLKLLPDCALEVLNAIFHQAVTCGLPTHILQTRVGVLSKVELPCGMHQSRPIVIFSCLYRVWASVMAKQILRQWAPSFPRAIAGSMPQRACRDVSYREQWRVEASLLSSTPLLGLSIDIIKCFNQIGWAPAGAVLRLLGVPAEVAAFWVDCLRKHSRRTVFCGSLSTDLVCYNGVPEGDPMSVVVMAGICYVADRACATPQVDYESYVDNWCWLSASRTAIAAVIPKALSFLDCLALPIDFTKSYVWATKRIDRKWWRSEAIALFPEGCLPKLVTEVRDLGVAFKFDRNGHRASRNHRLQAGCDRLDRLRQQPRAVLNKARLVQTAVWPQCLYGCEGHLHSLAEFANLRGKAARAIVGQYKIMSPHLAMVALADVVQDPFVYCLERQLSAFRRACLHDPETAIEVLQVATADHGPSRAQGPATALRLSLDRLGLTLQADTCLKGLDNSRVRLDTCSMQEVRALLHRSWALHVQGLVSHRNGLSQASPVYSPPVVRLLAKLNGPEQAVIMRHVTGSFSSAAAKQLWADDTDGCCPLCGQRQTKYHKVVECPALQEVRADWLPHLRLVLDRWPSWVHCPVTTLPDDLEVPQLVFHTRSLPDPVVNFTAWPQLSRRNFLRLYTDGSCRHSGVSLAHHAGFAVVLDTSADDTAALEQLQQWRTTKVVPVAFSVIVQGLVPGQQTINRAELCAVLQAVRAAWNGGFVELEIWTDSQYVIQLWQDGSAAPGDPNYDLSVQLLYWKAPSIRLRKVASHQDLDTLTGMAQWHAAGNYVVDLAAKAAVRADLNIVTNILDAAAQHVSSQTDVLLLFWRYLLALSLAESRLLRLQQAPPLRPDDLPPAGQDDAAGAMQQRKGLESWLCLNQGPSAVGNLPDLLRPVMLACSWPPWFTVPLWKWLRALRWQSLPQRGRAPDGVTYLELLVDFVVSTGVVPPESLEQAALVSVPQTTWPRPVTTRTWTHVLVEAVRQLERLSRLQIWGPKRNKVFSLRHLQVATARHGLPCRPIFQQARVVGDLLQSVLRQGSVTPLQQYVRWYTGPWHHDSALQHDWQTLTTANRAALAKDLRKTRRL